MSGYLLTQLSHLELEVVWLNTVMGCISLRLEQRQYTEAGVENDVVQQAMLSLRLKQRRLTQVWYGDILSITQVLAYSKDLGECILEWMSLHSSNVDYVQYLYPAATRLPTDCVGKVSPCASPSSQLDPYTLSGTIPIPTHNSSGQLFPIQGPR